MQIPTWNVKHELILEQISSSFPPLQKIKNINIIVFVIKKT